MSEHWTVFCEDCQEYGPDIMRSAGSPVRFSGIWPRFHGTHAQRGDTDERWQTFLEQHGYHRLGLVHE